MGVFALVAPLDQPLCGRIAPASNSITTIFISAGYLSVCLFGEFLAMHSYFEQSTNLVTYVTVLLWLSTAK